MQDNIFLYLQQEDAQIKEILKNFKTQECTADPESHASENCIFYHKESEKRRTPFVNDFYNQQLFAYSNKICNNLYCGHQLQKQNCKDCINNFEVLFHPENYKTSAFKCQNFSNCEIERLKCPYLHEGEVPRILINPESQQQQQQQQQSSRIPNFMNKQQNNNNNNNNNNFFESDNSHKANPQFFGMPFQCGLQSNNNNNNNSALGIYDQQNQLQQQQQQQLQQQFYQFPQQQQQQQQQQTINPPQQIPMNIQKNNNNNNQRYQQQQNQRGSFQKRDIDIDSFKTKPCPKDRKKPGHNLKTCIYYHNNTDRRRPQSKFDYWCDKCPHGRDCKMEDNCSFAHNKVEQLYHKSRYKSKFCKFWPDKIDQCDYGEYCSFAHSQNEIKIELIDTMEKDDNFNIWKYKTVFCPYTYNHDRGQCPYAHNVQDYRRDPAQYELEPEDCKDWIKSENITLYSEGGCKNLLNCTKCHGWKELEYHPQVYKTKHCTNGKNCKKKDCAYYHNAQKDKNNKDFKYFQGQKKSLTQQQIHEQEILQAQYNQVQRKSSNNIGMPFNVFPQQGQDQQQQQCQKKHQPQQQQLQQNPQQQHQQQFMQQHLQNINGFGQFQQQQSVQPFQQHNYFMQRPQQNQEYFTNLNNFSNAHSQENHNFMDYSNNQFLIDAIHMQQFDSDYTRGNSQCPSLKSRDPSNDSYHNGTSLSSQTVTPFTNSQFHLYDSDTEPSKNQQENSKKPMWNSKKMMKPESDSFIPIQNLKIDDISLNSEKKNANNNNGVGSPQYSKDLSSKFQKAKQEMILNKFKMNGYSEQQIKCLKSQSLQKIPFLDNMERQLVQQILNQFIEDQEDEDYLIKITKNQQQTQSKFFQSDPNSFVSNNNHNNNNFQDPNTTSFQQQQ